MQGKWHTQECTPRCFWREGMSQAASGFSKRADAFGVAKRKAAQNYLLECGSASGVPEHKFLTPRGKETARLAATAVPDFIRRPKSHVDSDRGPHAQRDGQGETAHNNGY